MSRDIAAQFDFNNPDDIVEVDSPEIISDLEQHFRQNGQVFSARIFKVSRSGEPDEGRLSQSYIVYTDDMPGYMRVTGSYDRKPFFDFCPFGRDMSLATTHPDHVHIVEAADGRHILRVQRGWWRFSETHFYSISRENTELLFRPINPVPRPA